MKLEPKPALQATLYLALMGGAVVGVVLMPEWVLTRVFPVVFLPICIGALWYLMYASLRDRDRLKKLKNSGLYVPRKSRQNMKSG
jgi:hypothetical protein